MQTSVSPLHLSHFRCPGMIWMIMIAFIWSLCPAVSLAQPSPAQISSLKGTVLVNGQPAAQGTALRSGDVIETRANATVVLQLPDGSQIEVGESTQLNVAELFATSPGVRTSRLKLAYGWVRAKLSPEYNKGVEATFEVETPNALVGVKFSPPDTRVSYEPDVDPQKAKTVAKGFSNQLDVLNKVTGERIVSQIGETVTITAAGIIVAGAVGFFSAKTLVMGGLAGAAVVGGVVALTSGEEEKKNFTGRFRYRESSTDYQEEKILELTQNGEHLSGTFSYYTRDTSGRVLVECRNLSPILVTGNVIAANRAQIRLIDPYVRCSDNYPYQLPGVFDLTLTNDGKTLIMHGSDWDVEMERT